MFSFFDKDNSRSSFTPLNWLMLSNLAKLCPTLLITDSFFMNSVSIIVTNCFNVDSMMSYDLESDLWMHCWILTKTRSKSFYFEFWIYSTSLGTNMVGWREERSPRASLAFSRILLPYVGPVY